MDRINTLQGDNDKLGRAVKNLAIENQSQSSKTLLYVLLGIATGFAGGMLIKK